MLIPGALDLDVTSLLTDFERDGFARLGPVLHPDGLEALRERSLDLMLGRVVHPGLFFQLDATTGRYEDAPLGLGWQGPSLAYRKLEKLERDPRFRTWINNPLFERLARGHIPGDVAIYRAILFNKGEAGGSPIPWHQDGGDLWGLSAAPTLQVWTALDDAPSDGGCLEILPGSHRWGLATPLGGVVPRIQVEDERANELAVKVPVRAGEALLVHNWVWHRSGINRPGARRLAFSVCYMSAATRCLRKRRAPREFFRVFGEHGVLEDFEAGGSRAVP